MTNLKPCIHRFIPEVDGSIHCKDCPRVWIPKEHKEKPCDCPWDSDPCGAWQEHTKECKEHQTKPKTQISGDPVRPGYNHIQSKPKCDECTNLHTTSIGDLCRCDCHGEPKGEAEDITNPGPPYGDHVDKPSPQRQEEFYGRGVGDMKKDLDEVYTAMRFAEQKKEEREFRAALLDFLGLPNVSGRPGEHISWVELCDKYDDLRRKFL